MDQAVQYKHHRHDAPELIVRVPVKKVEEIRSLYTYTSIYIYIYV